MFCGPSGAWPTQLGPVLATRIADALTDDLNKKVVLLPQFVPSPAVPFRFYDVALTADGLTYRFCPAPSGPTHPHPPTNDGLDPVIA